MSIKLYTCIPNKVNMENVHGYGTGMWAWLLQRITGLLLVFYLFVHIWWAHFSDIKTPFDSLLNTFFVHTRSSLFILLVLVLPHALNGFRVFAVDLGIGYRTQKLMFWLLMFIGIAIIAFSFYSDFYA